MTIASVVAVIKTGLETISGLRVFDYPPDAIGEFPAAIILQGNPVIEFDTDIAGSYHLYRLRIMVLVSRPGEATQSWDDLESYMAATGSGSVRAAVDGTARRATAVEAAGRIKYNDTDYWGIVFLVEDYAA